MDAVSLWGFSGFSSKETFREKVVSA